MRGLETFRNKQAEELLKMSDAFAVICLAGVRRTGKTTLMKEMIRLLKDRGVWEDQILFLDFENGGSGIRTAQELSDYISDRLMFDEKTWVFLDEILEIPDWTDTVSVLTKEYDVSVIACSSCPGSMREQAKELPPDCCRFFPVWPMNFRQYKDSCDLLSDEETDISDCADRYLVSGGLYPSAKEAQTGEEGWEERSLALSRDLFGAILYYGVIRAGELRRTDQLEMILEYALTHAGEPVSPLSVCKELKKAGTRMDPATVYQYIDKLEGSGIIMRCPRYDLKTEEILKTLEKFYPSDLSFFRCALDTCLCTGKMQCETALYLDLKSRGYRVFTGRNGTAQISFVAQRDHERIYVQLYCPDGKTGADPGLLRKHLLSVKDNFTKYLVYWGECPKTVRRDGIRICSLDEFLLLEELEKQ